MSSILIRRSSFKLRWSKGKRLIFRKDEIPVRIGDEAPSFVRLMLGRSIGNAEAIVRFYHEAPSLASSNAEQRFCKARVPCSSHGRGSKFCGRVGAIGRPTGL